MAGRGWCDKSTTAGTHVPSINIIPACAIMQKLITYQFDSLITLYDKDLMLQGKADTPKKSPAII
jgi:hypothetical protein